MHACPHCTTEVPDDRLLGGGEMAKCPGCDKLHTVPKPVPEVVWVEENYEFLTIGKPSDRLLVPPMMAVLGFLVGGIVMIVASSGRHNQTFEPMDAVFLSIPFLFIIPGYLAGKKLLVKDKAKVEALPGGPEVKRFRVDGDRFWIPTVLILHQDWRWWMLDEGFGGVWLPVENIREAKLHVVTTRSGNSTQSARRITLTLGKPWSATLPRQPEKPFIELISPTKFALWINELTEEKQFELFEFLGRAPRTRVVDEID